MVQRHESKIVLFGQADNLLSHLGALDGDILLLQPNGIPTGNRSVYLSYIGYFYS
jgi:hypothetical protein